MDSSVYWLCMGGVLLSAALTGWVRRMALARGMLDRPNERSSHVLPTPRGGGLAIVVTTSVLVVAFASAGQLDWPLAWALLGGGLPIAWIGYQDDRRSVSVRIRICVHFAAATWAIFILGGLPPLQVGAYAINLGIIGDLCAVLAVVWALNLFNFMDGIDGIAATEAMFIALVGALLLAWSGFPRGSAVAALAISAACAGFLAWNWPPARIFMGDVGSGYVGFTIAVLALGAARVSPVACFTWLILGGVFFADATLTLLRRLADGERVHEAHRTHAYQILARRLKSHRSATLIVMAVNGGVLAPLAFLATYSPPWAAAITALVLLLLGVPMARLGAGQQVSE